MGNTQASKKEGCLAFFLRRLFKSKFIRLITAIKHGNLSLVKYYYANKVNFSRYMDNGDTPLHVAVKYNRIDIVKFICDNVLNVNINDRNFVGDTPLLIASMNGNFEIVKYLVLYKADPDIPENRGFTPFIAACAHGDIDIVKFLVTKGGANYKLKAFDGQTGLHRAAFYGNCEVIVYLIKDLKMNVMVPDKKGNLPLHLACMKLNITCVRVLMRTTIKDASASLYMQNKYGISPLDILVKQFNRLREPGDYEEYKAEEIEEYLKDKNNVPHRKKSLASPTPIGSRMSFRRTSILERSADFKKKFKDFFNRNSLFGSGENNIISQQQSPEPESATGIKLNNLPDHIFGGEDNQESVLVHEEELKAVEDPDILSEEQRLTGADTKLLSPSRQNAILGFQKRKTLRAQTRATGILVTTFNGIRKSSRSPSLTLSENPLSMSQDSKDNPLIPQRAASNTSPLKANNLLSEESKLIIPSHFATKVKSRFAQNS